MMWLPTAIPIFREIRLPSLVVEDTQLLLTARHQTCNTLCSLVVVLSQMTETFSLH